MIDAQDVIIFLPGRKLQTGESTSNGGTLTDLDEPSFLALFSEAPTISTDGTELSGAAYARAEIEWGDVEDDARANSAPISTPKATADWAEAEAFGVFDAASGGNLLYFGPLRNAVTILSGQFGRVPEAWLAVSEP